MENQSNFQKAFFDQQKYSEEEVDEINRQIQEYQNENFQKAYQHLVGSDPNDLKNSIDIPTENPILDGKPEVHPQMKDYDHSLEKNRWKEIGGRSLDDLDEGIEINYEESQDHQK